MMHVECFRPLRSVMSVFVMMGVFAFMRIVGSVGVLFRSSKTDLADNRKLALL